MTVSELRRARRATCCEPVKRQYHVRYSYDPVKRKLREGVTFEEIVYQHDVYQHGNRTFWRGMCIG